MTPIDYCIIAALAVFLLVNIAWQKWQKREIERSLDRADKALDEARMKIRETCGKEGKP